MILCPFRHAIFIGFIVALCGCTVTRFTAPAVENPIPQIASAMRDEGFSVTVSEDEREIILRDTWPIHSVISTGWTRYYARATWTDGKLNGWTYLKIQSLQNLLVPQYVDFGHKVFGSFLKSRMKKDFHAILAAGEIDRKSVRYWHGVDRKEMQKRE